MEIKRLNGRIAAARSELNKAAEHLADCERFKQFLDAITPEAHFEAERAARERARAAAEAEWLAECDAVEASKVDAANAKQQAEHDYANARTQQVLPPTPWEQACPDQPWITPARQTNALRRGRSLLWLRERGCLAACGVALFHTHDGHGLGSSCALARSMTTAGKLANQPSNNVNELLLAKSHQDLTATVACKTVA